MSFSPLSAPLPNSWAQPGPNGPPAAPISNPFSYPNNSANGPPMNNVNSNFQLGPNSPSTRFPTLGGNNYYPAPPYNQFVGDLFLIENENRAMLKIKI